MSYNCFMEERDEATDIFVLLDDWAGAGSAPLVAFSEGNSWPGEGGREGGIGGRNTRS